MKTARTAVLLILVVVTAMPALARGKKSTPATIEPGTYQNWGPDIDELEIVKTFKFSDYRKVVVEPFDTSSVALPEKSDNTYEPVTKVLASATEGFVQGLRGSVEPKVSIENNAGKSSGTLLIRGKVVALDPGSKAARYWAENTRS